MTLAARSRSDPALRAMLEARTVAVVGASGRPGSFGKQMMLQLRRGGFDGEIVPVSPRYEEVGGLRCFPNLAAIGRSVDVALLGVPNALLEEQMQVAAGAGVRSVVIFASCYEDPVPGIAPLPDRITSLARGAGMAVCGPNCMGFLNIERGLRACGFSMPEDLRPGGVSFITHSGSAFAAFAHNDRDIRFNLVVSTGMELVTTAAGYLDYVLELDSTSVVAMFLESVRDPAAFRDALAKAAERDIPLVVLKVGREGRARDLVQAHSGALAGEDGAYEALFDAYNVRRVRTLDEMADTIELFAAGRRATPGGLASIHDSGGERALMVDVAGEIGVELALLGEATTARLQSLLEPGLPAVNPLDAWGTGNNAGDIFRGCMNALLDDANVGALAFSVDLTTETDDTDSYVSAAIDVFEGSTKPVAVMSNLASAIDRKDGRRLRAAGVPVLETTATGLAAFKHLLAYRAVRAREPVEGLHVPERIVAGWRARLASGPLSEREALALIDDFGIPVIRSSEARDLESALSAAADVGYPVALKTAHPGVVHKAAVGGVVLGVRDAEELRGRYEDMSRRVGPEVTVAAMAEPGIEVALGVVRDAQFGPLVMVGAGGVLVEVLRDRAFALPPLDVRRAAEITSRLAIAPLLKSAPADLDALHAAIARLSVLATALGEEILALDVNPVIVGPAGCVAVDALVVT